MDKDTFVKQLRAAQLEGLTFDNIHKGDVSVISNNQERIHYQRNKETISFKYSKLNKTWDAFKGNTITDEELKAWKPHWFDSRATPKPGHDSNCGVFLFLLQHIGLAENVKRNKRHYSATILQDLT